MPKDLTNCAFGSSDCWMKVATTGWRCWATVPQMACPNSSRVMERAVASGMPVQDANRKASPDSFTMKLK